MLVTREQKLACALVVLSVVSLVWNDLKGEVIEAYKVENKQLKEEIAGLKKLEAGSPEVRELELSTCWEAYAKLQSDFDNEAFWKGSECDRSLEWCMDEFMTIEREMEFIIEDIEQDFLDTGPYDCGWTSAEVAEIRRGQEELQKELEEEVLGDEAYVEPPC